MAPIVTALRTPRAVAAYAFLPERTPQIVAVLATIGAAWLIAVFAELTGRAMAFHHHTLIEGGLPLWIALPIFLAAWQVMIAAMMLPASLPAVGTFDRLSRARTRPGLAMAAFLGAYAALWTVYGAGAFMFDVGLHRLVDATPWLAARPWLIESSAIAAAGVYQFLPPKRWGLQACRHPVAAATGAEGPIAAAARQGLDHGLECLTSSWALMLLMFSAGFANLWWMVALAGVMVYETTGRHGRRAASIVGGTLFAFAALVMLTGTIPAFVGE